MFSGQPTFPVFLMNIYLNVVDPNTVPTGLKPFMYVLCTSIYIFFFNFFKYIYTSTLTPRFDDRKVSRYLSEAQIFQFVTEELFKCNHHHLWNV